MTSAWDILEKKLCPAGKAAAKRKFKVYPSAYANGWAVQYCKGKFRGKKKNKVKKAEVCQDCGMQFDPNASRFFGANPNATLCPNCEYNKGFSGYYTGE
jgi:hypothetical protein